MYPKKLSKVHEEQQALEQHAQIQQQIRFGNERLEEEFEMESLEGLQ